MPANPTPRNIHTLRALAHDLAQGCAEHEATLGIKQNTAAVVRAALAASESARMERARSLAARAAAYAALADADAAGLRVLTHCKLRLAHFYGLRWNSGWEAAAFPDRSTAVPRTMDPRFVLLGMLALYFEKHPEHESEEAEATRARCAAAHEAVRAAHRAVAQSERAVTEALRAERAANAALRKRVRGLIRELWILMARDDSRWLSFGLNIPAQLTAPPRVEAVRMEQSAPDAAEVSWPHTPRSHRFRVEIRVVGVDEHFRKARTVRGLQVTLRGFKPGDVLEARVIAGNSRGESPPSEPARMVIGAHVGSGG